jgi:sensor domain CHASE-containing protein
MTLNLVSVMWIVWAVCALTTAFLTVYRTSITRDEEGQIFLDEAFAHEKAVQTAITTKVGRLQPILTASQVLTGVVTLCVIGYYAWIVEHSLFG